MDLNNWAKHPRMNLNIWMTFFFNKKSKNFPFYSDTKEVDGLLAGLVITPDRKERMDYTSMIWTEPFTLVVPKPEQESRLLAFIRPFQPLVNYKFSF